MSATIRAAWLAAYLGIAGLNNAATIENAGIIAGHEGGILLDAGGTVSNAAGGTVSGSSAKNIGVEIKGSPGSVYDAGLISGYNAINMSNGGFVTVASTGTIDGSSGQGIVTYNGSAITNSGSIGGKTAAIHAVNGGTVINLTGGNITASGGVSRAIDVEGGAGTIYNAGTIEGPYDGVVLIAGGLAVNAGLIEGTGNVGVYVAGGGTVVNYGTIIGGSSGAVQFSGGENDRLIVGIGAAFGGTVSGGSGVNTLELAANGFAPPGTYGTIASLGNYKGFTQISLDADADWTVEGSIAAADTINFNGAGTLQLGDAPDFAGTISGFGIGDTIDLAGFSVTSEILNANGLTLSSGSQTATLALSGSLAPGYYSFTSDGHAGTDLVFNNGVSIAPLVSIISTTVTSIVTPGAGVYADGITITSTGAVYVYPGMGIYSDTANASVTNAGYIYGSYAVQLNNGGAVNNQAGGTITTGGREAINISNAAGTVTNAGKITGVTDGVVLKAGGVVNNSGLINGTGNVGVYVYGGGTVENSGTISGQNQSVQFNFGGDATLIINPGAVFIGTVAGGYDINTIELASSASAGTITNIDANYTGFNQISLDQNADWVINGPVATGDTVSFNGAGELQLGDAPGFAGTIANFGVGDTIDLQGFTASSENFSNGVLTLSGAGGSIDLNFAGAFGNSSFSFSGDGNGGTDIVPCFCSGTRILGLAGPILVEDIAEGDILVTVRESGPTTGKVIWTGCLPCEGQKHPSRKVLSANFITTNYDLWKPTYRWRPFHSIRLRKMRLKPTEVSMADIYIDTLDHENS